MITITIRNIAPLNAETGKAWPIVVEIQKETLIPNGVSITKEEHCLQTDDELVALASVLESLKSQRATWDEPENRKSHSP